MEELGIGRPSTYASTLAVLRERDYVRIEKKRLVPEDKGRLVTAFLESFFARYVEYDFTAELEEQLDRVSNHEIDWKQVLRDFWPDFSAALDGTKDLRTTQVLDSLNEILGPHIFPAKEDGSNPRACPSCGDGQLSLKLGKFGAFIGCSNYPECKFTRTLVGTNGERRRRGRASGRASGFWATTPRAGARNHSARRAVSAPMCSRARAKSRSASSLPKTIEPGDIDACPSASPCCRCRARSAKHPESKEPILAGIGRYGPYVQHGKTYANIGKDEDILGIGGNRAIDLIVAKESGLTGRRFGDSASAPARVLGEHPSGRHGRAQGRALRPLCQPWQGQRDLAERCRSHHFNFRRGHRTSGCESGGQWGGEGKPAGPPAWRTSEGGPLPCGAGASGPMSIMARPMRP